MTFDEWWNSEAAKPVKYGVTDLSEDDLAAIFQAGAASERTARDIAERDSEACARQMTTERERAEKAEARVKELEGIVGALRLANTHALAKVKELTAPKQPPEFCTVCPHAMFLHNSDGSCGCGSDCARERKP